MTTAAQHDAAVRAAFHDRPSDAETDGRIVDGRLVMGSVILDSMSDSLQRLFEMFFQQEPGVIGADRNAHDGRLYYGFRAESP